SLRAGDGAPRAGAAADRAQGPPARRLRLRRPRRRAREPRLRPRRPRPPPLLLPVLLSVTGILPAHGLLGAFFAATSMIGFIAGAGIIVRNSIILVDFIELQLRPGMALEEAVVEAGAVRSRPMLLTAAAVVVGSFVMLFDPIFQGLAISLMTGEIAA